jgi:hypothetical protein
MADVCRHEMNGGRILLVILGKQAQMSSVANTWANFWTSSPLVMGVEASQENSGYEFDLFVPLKLILALFQGSIGLRSGFRLVPLHLRLSEYYITWTGSFRRGYFRSFAFEGASVFNFAKTRACKFNP